jgi:inner membrane protein
MDSLTHVLTGMAFGQIFSEEKDKFKPLIWGAIAGNIPDLDVVFQPFISPESSMLFHRGLSHSLLLWALCSPLLTLLINKIYKGNRRSYFRWLAICATAWLSHLTLDLFNTYGTGIFEPFSHARISYDAVNVYDLCLSIPVLLVTGLFVLIIKNHNIKRIVAITALLFSTAYISCSAIIKSKIEMKAQTQLVETDVRYGHLISSPLPLSNLAWKIIAENSEGYYVGTYYGFWKDKTEFKFIPKNKHLETKLEQYSRFRKLKQFTANWYALEQTDSEIFMHDLRFASLGTDERTLCFTLYIKDHSLETGRTYINRHITFKNMKAHLKRLTSCDDND